jgi:hypothetical protein
VDLPKDDELLTEPNSLQELFHVALSRVLKIYSSTDKAYCEPFHRLSNMGESICQRSTFISSFRTINASREVLFRSQVVRNAPIAIRRVTPGARKPAWRKLGGRFHLDNGVGGCRFHQSRGGEVRSPAASARTASRLAVEAPSFTKISIAAPGVDPRFLNPCGVPPLM